MKWIIYHDDAYAKTTELLQYLITGVFILKNQKTSILTTKQTNIKTLE